MKPKFFIVMDSPVYVRLNHPDVTRIELKSNTKDTISVSHAVYITYGEDVTQSFTVDIYEYGIIEKYLENQRIKVK